MSQKIVLSLIALVFGLVPALATAQSAGRNNISNIVFEPHFVGVVLGVSTTANASCADTLAARKAQIQQWLNLYAAADKAYNDLYKAVALAAHAPTGYIWNGVSPDIAQGPGITDSLDGKTILRADLYYGHDIAAQAREACRALNCESFHLPATHAGAQSALNAYFAAVEAMPRFAGPIGMQLQGSSQRLMEMVDANALRDELANSSTTCENEQNGTQAPAELNREILQSSGQGTPLGGQTTPAANCAAPSRTLARGARGVDVTALQKFLAARGLMASSSATGFFGALTETAVQKMQSQDGIVSSGSAATTGFGRVGQRTLAIIRARCGGTTATQPSLTTPARTNTESENSDSQTTQSPADRYNSWMNGALDSIKNTTVDQCSNIPDVQVVVPAGYHGQSGQCISDADWNQTGNGAESSGSCGAITPTSNTSLIIQNPMCYYYQSDAPMNPVLTTPGNNGEPNMPPRTTPPSTTHTGGLAVGTPVSGIPSTVTYYIWTPAQSGSMTIEFGDGQSANAPSCTAPSGICLTPGTLTHVYTAAGPYTATLKSSAGVTLGTVSLTISSQQPTNPLDSYVAGTKPDLAQFIKAAHTTNTARASSLLYGVIGSAKDIRDWSTIMAASDPLKAACQATNAMYNSGNSSAYMPAGAKRFADLDQTTVTLLAKTTNFIFYKEVIPGAGIHYNLMLTDSNGYLLTAPANSDILVQHLSNYCFDKSQLTSLQAQLNAIGFNQAVETSWPQGFIGTGYSPQDPSITGATLTASSDRNAQLASALTAVQYALEAIMQAFR